MIKSEEEFNKLEPNEKTIFEYKTACEHTRSMSYKSFMNGNGDFCLDCTKKRRGDKCREKTKIQYEDMIKEFESKGCIAFKINFYTCIKIYFKSYNIKNKILFVDYKLLFSNKKNTI